MHALFPFQIGAIKSLCFPIPYTDEYKFPFQIGAIKSLLFLQLNLQRKSFHSRLVRLKENSPDAQLVVLPTFPFQIGAIKREPPF